MRSDGLTSVRVGDVLKTKPSVSSLPIKRIAMIAAAVLALFLLFNVGRFALSATGAFSLTNISVNGVEHLTDEETRALAGVSDGSSLVAIDTAKIESRLLRDAWIEKASVTKQYPDTLNINVTERTIAAVVEIPVLNSKSTQPWAIASDGMWLMPIPDQNSEAGKRTSPKVYEDAEKVLRISEVPYGTAPEVGAHCTDGNVNNALDVVSGLTTDLAGQVVAVAATEPSSTTLTLQNGVEIVFGTAEDVRTKERVVLEIMDTHQDVTYVNVRNVDRPTWRGL